MNIEIPAVRFQHLIAIMFLGVAFIAPKDYQMLACLLMAATSFIWGVIEGAVDLILDGISYGVSVEIIKQEAEGD